MTSPQQTETQPLHVRLAEMAMREEADGQYDLAALLAEAATATEADKRREFFRSVVDKESERAAKPGRLSGQDVSISFCKGEALQEDMDLFMSCKMSFDSDRATLTLRVHQRTAAWFDFITNPADYTAIITMLWPSGQSRRVTLTKMHGATLVGLAVDGRKDAVVLELTVKAWVVIAS